MFERVILHVDINNFYASATLVCNPELKGTCFVISGNPDKRHGIILAKSDLAKKAGIKTGETLVEARKKAEGLIAVPPDFKKYSELSKKAITIYKEYTPIVESFGLDECWLDVTKTAKLFGGGKAIAETIRKRIKQELGITVSVGVAFTKTFAKLGSDMKKPDAVTVIDQYNYRIKIWQLPLTELLYIGKSSAERLHEMNLFTIGDLACYNKKLLIRELGKNGEKLYEMANGVDNDEVDEKQNENVPQSISNGATAERDIDNIEDASSLIYSLSSMVSYRLRKEGLMAFGVSICIRDNQLKCTVRQMQLLAPTADTKEIADYALSLLSDNHNFKTNSPLRMLTVGTYNLVNGDLAYQNSFFEERTIKVNPVNEKLDALRSKYGYGILKRAIEINPGFACDAREAEDGYVPFDRRGDGLDEPID